MASPRRRPVLAPALATLAALAAAVALGACTADDAADAPATTVPAEPVCVELATLGSAWDVQAAGPVLGDPDALRAAAADQEAAIVGSIDAALATGEVPPDVAADLELVRAGAVGFLDAAVAWATGDDPGAQPVLEPRVTDAQRRIDGWALEACGAEVWP